MKPKVFANGTAEVYEYDALSRLTGVTYPSGRAVRYTYDAVGNRLEMIEGTASGGVGGGGACAGDADCDGVPDATDNCPAVHNTAQTDSDAPATPADLVAGLQPGRADGIPGRGRPG